VVDAQVNIRDDKVFLRKRCRDHGEFEALVYGDAQAYLASARFNKPDTIPLTFQTDVRDGCPSDNLDEYLDYVTNRVLPDQAVRTALEKLWSASAFMGADTTAHNLETTIAECDTCGIDLPKAVKELDERAFMIVVQDFQDPYTLNVKQLMKCCVEEITPDGRIIPFCAYNSVGYREQVREQMSGVAVADVVPNAIALRPRVTDSPYGSKIARTGNGTGNGHRPSIAPDTTNVGRWVRKAR
jgi:uncharacterized radical SAM superfamily Fe-S cluster-containing enzyme